MAVRWGLPVVVQRVVVMRYTTAQARREAMDSWPRMELNNLQRRILRLITARDGITCDGIEAMLNMKHQTVSARIRELAQLGVIEPGPEPGKTRSGRRAVRWVRANTRANRQPGLF